MDRRPPELTARPSLPSPPMTRRAVLAILICLMALPHPAVAQERGSIEVLDVNGVVDERMVDWLIDQVTGSTADLLIIQLDSSATVGGDLAALADLVVEPPVPVVVWVGPAPAAAYGGAGQLLLSAPVRAAAPGTWVGRMTPTILGNDITPVVPVPDGLDEGRVRGESAAFIDHVEPSIGQLIVALDGVVVPTAAGDVVLETAEPITLEDGTESRRPTAAVTFIEPDLFSRTLRLSIRPEGALFFLTAGLALIAFELYAAGVGLMAGVGVASLLLAGYGLSTLPLRWWAVIAVIAGLWLQVWDVQRNSLGWRTIIGVGALTAGGIWFVDGGRQLAMRWWVVAIIAIGLLLFFAVGMTAVVRSRFSTRTIGRDGLIGRQGVAVGAFDHVGIVEIDGAQWSASSTRAADIRPGDPVVITAVDGVELVVDPAD